MKMPFAVMNPGRKLLVKKLVFWVDTREPGCISQDSLEKQNQWVCVCVCMRMRMCAERQGGKEGGGKGRKRKGKGLENE